jgi:hypothetical protein
LLLQSNLVNAVINSLLSSFYYLHDSVKNPDIQVPGFAAISAAEKKPDYPKYLKEMFGDRRWINVQDTNLLNYENTQLLLIGARKKDVEEELGIDIEEEKESQRSADLFKDTRSVHIRTT